MSYRQRLKGAVESFRNPVSVHYFCPKRRTDTGFPRKGELTPDFPRKGELTPDFQLTPDFPAGFPRAKRRTDTGFPRAKRRTDTGFPRHSRSQPGGNRHLP